MTKIVQNLDRLNDVTTYGGSLFENRLINPLFQVDIEGNAGGVTAAGSHVVEGWRGDWSSAVTTQTLSRVAGDSVPYALRYTVTTGSDASIAAGDIATINTAIEGYDCADALWGTVNAKPIWISGRVKAPTTGVYCISVRNWDANRTYVFEVECTAGTWVDFEHEVPGDTSGTWKTTTDYGVIILFAIAAGSTYQTTADTWSGGAFTATANQANGLATNGNIYEIEDIRVSVGKPIKTEWRPYALDLAHCQRYFRYFYFSYYYQSTNSAVGIGTTLDPPMRTAPTAGTRINWLSSIETGSSLVATSTNIYFTNSSAQGCGGQLTLSARLI